jgi:hypothetical protein
MKSLVDKQRQTPTTILEERESFINRWEGIKFGDE